MNIKDPSLYLLTEIVEGNIERLKIELSTLPEGSTDRQREIVSSITQYEQYLLNHQSKISEKLESDFQFSIEEVYQLFGQYEDEYINIEFHHYSESAKKFGRSISGILKYTIREREELEKATCCRPVPRTKGFVKVDCESDSLSDETLTELQSAGFDCCDIYKVTSVNLPRAKTFNQIGVKSIPNTVEVQLEYDKGSWSSLKLYVLLGRLKRGEQLIDEELSQYCGISLHINLSWSRLLNSF